MILLSIVLLLVFWAVGAYNRLVSLRNRAKHAFSQIDVQLKRRYDLIPHLVEIAQVCMKRERDTLEAVIAARTEAMVAKLNADPVNAAAVQQSAAAEGALSASLDRMLALSETYPDLKTNQDMVQLIEELTATENRIAFSRQAYNDAVIQYNTSLEQFPGAVIANLFAFKQAATMSF